jgi:peptidoglycan/LPS O-acetylase OafA/YrhL
MVEKIGGATPSDTLFGLAHVDRDSPFVERPSEVPPPENRLHYRALDGFRAIAVLMVFCQHYNVIDRRAWEWGWTGVDLFFVLSGFLITGILYDSRNAVNRVKVFYARRSLRIFPLYYGVLLLCLLLNPIFHWRWHPAWYLWPLYLGNYGHTIWAQQWNNGVVSIDNLKSTLPFHPPFILTLQHFWSLCVEEQFYLVWPAVVFLVKDRVRLRDICVAVFFLALAARIVCVHTVPVVYLNVELLYRFTFLRADALLLGGMIALMLRGPEARLLQRFVRPAFYLFILGFICFEANYRYRFHHFYFTDRTGPFISTIGFSLIDVFAAILILLAIDSSSALYRLLTLKPLMSLGRVSYGFYVFHDIPHDAYNLLVKRLYGTGPLAMYLVAALALLCTTVISYTSFQYFEKPFLKLKARFTTQFVDPLTSGVQAAPGNHPAV